MNIAFRVRIKLISIAKCDLFFHYCDTKEISFYSFRYTKLCAKHEKTGEFHLHCWDYVCKVNEWCLVDCFHHQLRVCTQIMVCGYCIAKSKKFSSRSGLLMSLWAIQNIYISSNPDFFSSSFCSSKPLVRFNSSADENLIIVSV